MRTMAALAFLFAFSGAAFACEADKARFAVGRKWAPALAEQARAKAGAIAVRRMIRGRAYTMEYFGGRLNLQTDVRGKVLGVSCG